MAEKEDLEAKRKLQHTANMASILAAMDSPPPPVESFTGMIYGPSGSGKSVTAAFLGKALNGPDEKTLFIDTSRGYVSFGNHPKLDGTFTPIAYQGLEHLETLAIMLERSHPGVKQYRTVVFDEISKMVRTDTNIAVADSGRDIPEWPDYNKSLSRLRKVIYRLLKRPDLNLVMLAHERDKKNKSGDVVLTFPDFIPSVVKELKEDIHVVARQTAAAIANPGGSPSYRRIIQCLPTASIDAKCRMTPPDLQISPEAFIMHVKAWLDAGGKVEDTPAPKEDVDLAKLEIPQGLQANLDDESIVELDDTAPAWVASS